MAHTIKNIWGGNGVHHTTTVGNGSFIKLDKKISPSAEPKVILEAINEFEKTHKDLNIIFWYCQESFSASMIGNIADVVEGIWVRHIPKK